LIDHLATGSGELGLGEELEPVAQDGEYVERDLGVPWEIHFLRLGTGERHDVRRILRRILHSPFRVLESGVAWSGLEFLVLGTGRPPPVNELQLALGEVTR
jgi:hypothetical protein